MIGPGAAGQEIANAVGSESEIIIVVRQTPTWAKMLAIPVVNKT
jgi:hypothetical protein